MTKKILQFIFLITAGIVVTWREWTFIDVSEKAVDQVANSVVSTEEFISNNWTNLQDAGSVNEANFILWVLFLAVILTVLINGILKILPNLSSPNSV